MGPFAVFLRTRATVFILTLLISLIWSALLCVELFVEWDVSDSLQRSLLLIFIFVDAITTVGIPTLFLIDFRWWSDAAATALLFLSHLSIAVVFTLANPNFTCAAVDAECKTTNSVILALSWIIPAILLSYAVYLVVMMYWQRRYGGLPEKRQSELPMMLPPADARSSANGLSSFNVPPDSGLPMWTPPGNRGSAQRTLSTVIEEDTPRSSVSRRLSKPLPKWFF